METKLSDELTLRAPVSVAERMNGVDFAQIVGSAADEAFEIGSAEAPFALQLRKRLSEV